jgi:hypothetical protein
MIIELDESIMDIKELNTNQDQDIIKSLNMLADIRKYGKHYILAKIPVLKHIVKLIKELDNNNSTKEIFEYILYNDIVQKYNQLLSMVKCKVLISTSNTTFKIEELDGIKIYNIPLPEFHKLFDLKETSFRSENIRDCEFYEHITYWFLDLKKKGINLNYKAIMGVDKVNIEYELNRSNDKTFCLIIVDSDKKYPNCEYGTTLKKCKDKYEKFKNNSVSELFYFENFHEKENLIPPSIYYKFFKRPYNRNNNKNYKENICKLISIEKEHHEHHEKLQYFDFKNGISLGDTRIKEYFKPLLAKINANNIGKVLTSRWINGDSNDKHGDSNDKHGDSNDKLNLNDKLKNYFKDHPREKITNELPNYIKKSWELLSITVFSWCCSPNRII